MRKRPPSSTEVRQQILQLWLDRPSLNAAVVAWSLYDGTTATAADDDLPSEPPYASALDAMRVGWRVVGISSFQPSVPGHECRTTLLPNEVVLERMREPAHV